MKPKVWIVHCTGANYVGRLLTWYIIGDIYNGRLWRYKKHSWE